MESKRSWNVSLNRINYHKISKFKVLAPHSFLYKGNLALRLYDEVTKVNIPFNMMKKLFFVVF
ncbi:hypothetical protein CHS0354_013770 [Potamilus streckersoni]|uniref:Uncharacterized protein n=1 Tax=Potamilus streckersoni TaxID=2493646 RepID=A0AAE0SH47_9BIVA|nr:hypothetical protein CHS0354_013770 [Potamilus streckersoni]